MKHRSFGELTKHRPPERTPKIEGANRHRAGKLDRPCCP